MSGKQKQQEKRASPLVMNVDMLLEILGALKSFAESNGGVCVWDVKNNDQRKAAWQQVQDCVWRGAAWDEYKTDHPSTSAAFDLEKLKTLVKTNIRDKVKSMKGGDAGDGEPAPSLAELASLNGTDYFGASKEAIEKRKLAQDSLNDFFQFFYECETGDKSKSGRKKGASEDEGRKKAAESKVNNLLVGEQDEEDEDGDDEKDIDGDERGGGGGGGKRKNRKQELANKKKKTEVKNDKTPALEKKQDAEEMIVTFLTTREERHRKADDKENAKEERAQREKEEAALLNKRQVAYAYLENVSKLKDGYMEKAQGILATAGISDSEELVLATDATKQALADCLKDVPAKVFRAAFSV